MKLRFLVLALLSLQWIFSPDLFAQDYSRFKKVKKWKVEYSIEIHNSFIYPDDRMDKFREILKRISPGLYALDNIDEDPQGFSFMKSHAFLIQWAADLKREVGVSYMVENSGVKGNLIFDTKDPASRIFFTWLGHGKISIYTNVHGEGEMWGGEFEGNMFGGGITNLNRDESWFEIDPESGTYNLFIVPGNDDNSGVKVKMFSSNNVWEETVKNISEKMGQVSEEVVYNELSELLEKEESFREGELFDYTDRDRWILDVEEVELPDSGLILKGERELWKGHKISWTIQPAN